MSEAYKRTTTLETHFGLTAAPADKDFVIDARTADMFVNIRDITGTAPTIQLTVVELVDARLSLPYDGQTVNFALGDTVRGQSSGATGLVVADTDGGATGTLELKNVRGRFRDDEVLEEVGGTGLAVVNSATGGTWVYTEDGQYGQTAALNAAASTRLELVMPLTGTPATAHLHPLIARRYRLKYTAGGTITNLDFDVDLLQHFC